MPRQRKKRKQRGKHQVDTFGGAVRATYRRVPNPHPAGLVLNPSDPPAQLGLFRADTKESENMAQKTAKKKASSRGGKQAKRGKGGGRRTPKRVKGVPVIVAAGAFDEYTPMPPPSGKVMDVYQGRAKYGKGDKIVVSRRQMNNAFRAIEKRIDRLTANVGKQAKRNGSYAKRYAAKRNAAVLRSSRKPNEPGVFVPTRLSEMPGVLPSMGLTLAGFVSVGAATDLLGANLRRNIAKMFLNPQKSNKTQALARAQFVTSAGFFLGFSKLRTYFEGNKLIDKYGDVFLWGTGLRALWDGANAFLGTDPKSMSGQARRWMGLGTNTYQVPASFLDRNKTTGALVDFVWDTPTAGQNRTAGGVGAGFAQQPAGMLSMPTIPVIPAFQPDPVQIQISEPMGQQVINDMQMQPMMPQQANTLRPAIV